MLELLPQKNRFHTIAVSLSLFVVLLLFFFYLLGRIAVSAPLCSIHTTGFKVQYNANTRHKQIKIWRAK